MRESNLVQGPTETEVKISVTELTSIAQKLQQAGFSESVPRVFEANVLFDTREGSLRSGGTMLRLRQVGERTVITWKGPQVAGPHKSRPETETTVESYDALHAILTEIGFQPTFRYEKFRTEYQEPSAQGVVTVDETPIGFFLELEGNGDWIDRTARRLGFSPTDYILDSYGKLYLADCEKHGRTPGNMIFPAMDPGAHR